MNMMMMILDYYNITGHSLVCNKLGVSKMHGATLWASCRTDADCHVAALKNIATR
jgi:hypothetical protein